MKFKKKKNIIVEIKKKIIINTILKKKYRYKNLKLEKDFTYVRSRGD